jgi:elongation factor Ts
MFSRTVAAVAEISGDELRGVPRRAAPGGGGEGDGETLGDAAAATAATVRENIRVRRAFAIAATGAGEVLGSYVHGAVAPGLGRQAAIVRLANVAGASGAKSAADKLAMHAVAAAPRFVDAASVPAAVAEAEAEIFRAQGAASGKPAAVVDKIVQGRMRKFHEEFCLAEQKCVFDDKVSATRWAREHGAGKDAAPDAFVRVKVGEGIEVEEKDFAAEVQATVRGA